MASRTIDDSSGSLEPLVPGTQRPRAGTRGQSLAPTPKAVAVSLVLFLLLSILLVESRPAAAVSGTLEAVYSQVPWPTALAFARDGRIFVAERYYGKIVIIENGTFLPDPFYTFDHLGTYDDQGLLGLALDPAFPTTPWVYAYYSFNDVANGTSYNRIVRIQATGNSGGSMEILLDRIPSGIWHIGGPIQFGPDGKLYALTGDSYNPANAQDLTTVAGKVLRLNPNGSVPDDNPFVGNASANPYIYTYGHRNLFGIAFHPITGDVFVTENGPECNDEVNRLIPGRNYGWGPNFTCFEPPPAPLNTNRDGPDPVLPLVWYTPEIAPTNAIVYDGPSFAAWHGDLFFGTWNTRNVHRLHLAPPRYDSVLSDDVVATLPSSEAGGVVEVEQGLDGAIWLTTPDTIYRFYDTSVPPIASFTTSPARPLVGDLVTFNGSASYDPDGSIESYAWDFGDGSSATGIVVAHSYATHGVYDVTLVVTDFDNLTGSQTAHVKVLTLPSASFAYGPPKPLAGAPVTFNASQSSDLDGNITAYRWLWGDGSNPIVSVSPVVDHTFATIGGYTVNLRVTDSDGLTNETSSSVRVFAAPSAVFTFSPISPREGQPVTLDGSASFDPDESIVLYSWDFGDGTNATGPSVDHVFSGAGSYPVLLTVMDSDGFTATAWETVSVNPLSPPAASFVESAELVSPGTDVTFNASGSADSDGRIVAYTWEFGDETNDTGVTTIHAYADSGLYTVTLTVLDDDHLTNSISHVVRVNAPPTATFGSTPVLAYPGVPVTFNASASVDSDGGVVSYAWDFGDDTTAEGIVVVHTFVDHGTFTVRLIVTDELGAHAETTKTMDVGNRGPVIESTTPTAALFVNASEATTFRVSASDPDGDPLTYAWTVDGNPVGVSSPTYEFVHGEAGTFVVRVVVSDGSPPVSFEWVVEVRERTTPQEFSWFNSSIVIGGTGVGVALLVVALVALMIRRRGRR